MRENFHLYLTDETVTLYKGIQEKLFDFNKNFEDARRELQNFLISSPKTPLSLLIDRNQQDIREEKLPPLFLWDRIRYLTHKKAEWLAQGGSIGFHFFKQEEGHYLQWIHILPHDDLTLWLSWMNSLPNPKKDIYFMPLEAGKFLKKHFPTSNDYKILVYPVSNSHVRHVVFKGRRLLLARLSQNEETLKTSLHFLSRSYPDIHNKLHVLSLVKDHSFSVPQVLSLPNSQAFLNFVSKLHRPTLALNKNHFSKKMGLRIGGGVFFFSIIIGMGTPLYQGMQYKKKALVLLTHTKTLHVRKNKLTHQLQGKNVSPLRHALEHYRQFQAFTVNPMKTMEKLSFLLKEQGIRLQNFKWRHGQKTEMEMGFFLEDKGGKDLALHLETCLQSLRTLSPQSQVHVLEAPYHSSPHETFKNPSDTPLPLTHIKMIFR